MKTNFTVNQMAEEWKLTNSTFAAYAAARHVPLGGTFELTPRCSLKCKMCYVRLEPGQMDAIGRELTAREWISLAREALRAGTVHLLLTGGEPMIRPDFAEIYSALCQMGFIITLNTNATLLTPEIVRLFEKYPPTEIAVTLYGAGPETYEKICGDGGGFDKTIRGLEMISRLSTQLEVRTTFIQDNMHELSRLRTIANRYTKRYAINTDVFKAIRGAAADVEECRLTPEQKKSVVLENHRYYDELNRDTNVKTPDQTNLNRPRKEHGFRLPPQSLECLAAKAMYWITWDGKMLPCGTFSEPYTLPLEEGFDAAWERLPGLFMDIVPPAECQACAYFNNCPNCPAILQAETGSFDRPAPYSCRIARMRSNAVH